jgi:phosphatidylinositol alpha-mannosyltransferase
MVKVQNLSIALVSSYAFTKEPGGVKDFILGLKQALVKRNCKVYVIAPGSKDAQKKGLVDFVLGVGFKITTDQTEFRASLSRKKTAKTILEVIKPDIVVIHEPFVPSIGHTIISSLGNPRPVIVGQFHARREELNWRLKLAEFIMKYFVRRPKLSRRTLLSLSTGYVSTINNNLNGRIAVSQATRKFWQKMLPADYKVIYNGIDTDKLTPDGPKINEWMKDGRKIVFFAGRHDPRKGIDDLINAINILVKDGDDSIKLKIAGRGKMTEDLMEMVDRLKLQKQVEFVGIMPYEKLIQAYRTADVVVAPSTGGEGFNRTIIEARACGTLVVCTDINGQNEAIGKDLSVFMARPGNPRDLALKIKSILNLGRAKRHEILRRGAEEVKVNFSWDNIAEEHIEYYKKLLD